MMLIVKTVILYFILIFGKVEAIKLKQVLLLSRHNIRAPFFEKTVMLNKSSDLILDVADLTPKGAMLEEGMGEYFRDLFSVEESGHECPTKDSIFICANYMERTIKTAKSFSSGAFKCNLTIDIQKGENSIFKAVIRNSSQEFKNRAIAEIQKDFCRPNFVRLFALLDNILKLSDAESRGKSVCDFTEQNLISEIKVGEELIVSDLLVHAFLVIDTISMGYYNGLPLNNSDWGDFMDPEHFKLLSQISQKLVSIKYGNYLVAKDMAKPMLKFMADTFLNGNTMYTLLFGHDTNLGVVITALKVKHFEIQNHFESTPIGGKLVFQKWFNEDTNENLFRLNYVYQSADDVRNGIRASLENPPQSILLEIDGCNIDEKGFCFWEDFINILLQGTS